MLLMDWQKLPTPRKVHEDVAQSLPTCLVLWSRIQSSTFPNYFLRQVPNQFQNGFQSNLLYEIQTVRVCCTRTNNLVPLPMSRHICTWNVSHNMVSLERNFLGLLHHNNDGVPGSNCALWGGSHTVSLRYFALKSRYYIIALSFLWREP